MKRSMESAAGMKLLYMLYSVLFIFNSLSELFQHLLKRLIKIICLQVSSETRTASKQIILLSMF